MARGHLALARCGDCLLVRNVAFDPAALTYSADYDASQWSSPRFRRFAEELARDLVGRYALTGRPVLEIGCGGGEFLRVLREAGIGNAIGIDPSFSPAASDDLPENVVIFSEEYSVAHAAQLADAVVCRQTLEHLADPLGFLRTLSGNLPSGTRVFYADVPNARAVFAGSSTWDLTYQHVNYFERRTLEKLCVAAGFRILAAGSALEGQFAYVEAEPGGGLGRGPTTEADGRSEELSTTDVAAAFAARVERARRAVREWRARGLRIALWGAGSRGVTFLDLIDVEGAVGAVVDLNPAKRGRFVPGSGQPILAPTALRDYRPDVVVLTNPLYEAEVKSMLHSLEIGVALQIM